MLKKILALVATLLFTTSVFASDTTKVNLKGTNKVKHVNIKINDARTIVLKGDVEVENIDMLIDQYRAFAISNSDPIYLIINSNGGDVNAGLNLVTTIKSLHVPTYCVIEEKAYSMAANLAQYCTQTYIHKYADMMFHNSIYTVRGTISRLHEILPFITKSDEVIKRDLASQMGISYDDYVKQVSKDWWITSTEAAQYGLVDGILDELYYTAKPPEPKSPLFNLFGTEKEPRKLLEDEYDVKN